MDELSFRIGKAIGPSATSPWHRPCPRFVAILCLLLGRSCVFRQRVIIIVHRYALPPLLLNVASQRIAIDVSLDVRRHIAVQNPTGIHCLTRHRWRIHARNGSASLALERNRRRRLNPQVPLHDVEDWPHKNQKWIYKIKMLQMNQFIVSNFKFIVSQIRLFHLIIKFKFLTKSKNGSKIINCYK